MLINHNFNVPGSEDVLLVQLIKYEGVEIQLESYDGEIETVMPVE